MRSRDGGNSDEFIREVDEAVRQDQWTAIWKQYGNYIMGAGVAIVVGTSAGIAWQNYQANKLESQARSFAAASALLAEDKPADAASAFRALASEAGDGVGMIALLRSAEAEKDADNPSAKLETLKQLAASSDIDPIYSRLAKLLVLQEEFNDADAESLIAELEAEATPDNPWRASLLELKAMAEVKAGQINDARATLAGLIDGPTTPDNLARRATEFLEALGGPLEDDNQTVSQNSNDDTEEVSQ